VALRSLELGALFLTEVKDRSIHTHE
jgi:hypothetical protein